LLSKTTCSYNFIAEKFSSAREVVWPEFSFLFTDFLVPGDKILDIGCGNGRFFELCNNKISYFGIDSSEELIKIAKNRYAEANFQVADALKLPFSDNYFDKVYSIAVFQHIPSKEFRQQFLNEVKRVLKPGGFLFLTVWNLWNWNNIKTLTKNSILKVFGLSKLDFKDFFLSNKNSFFNDFYYHAFTKKELENLIKKVSFRVEKSGLIIRSSSKKRHSNFYIIAQKN